MSFDDGMQFANKVTTTREVLYFVSCATEYGKSTRSGLLQELSFQSTDLEAIKAEAAKFAADSDRYQGVHIRVFLPSHKYSNEDAITLDEYQASQPQEAASESPVTESVESVEVSTEIEEKPFKVFVKGSLKSDGNWFDTIEEAKAFVASQIGKCSQVGIEVRAMGAWTLLRSVEGCYWDAADQYEADWNAGKFIEAFKRDYANEEAARLGK